MAVKSITEIINKNDFEDEATAPRPQHPPGLMPS
jgi:hypothetical protein